MNKITRLFFRSFTGPFLITFFIAVFVFLMIFVFVYLDEFIGKNISSFSFVKLFFLFSLNTVPRALPLALLLSSIMTLGVLTEYFQLSALQSAGISFLRITRPLLLFSLCTGLFLGIFTESVLTRSNLSLQTLLMSIRSSKPSLLFKEGTFNNALDGYTIRIGKLSKSGEQMAQVLIYDHTNQEGNTTVITADSGTLVQPTPAMLEFQLKNGCIYKENTGQKISTQPSELFRESFGSFTMRFDLEEFAMKKFSSDNYRNDYSMLKLSGISSFIDTLQARNNMLRLHPEIADRQLRIEVNNSNRRSYLLEWHKRFAIPFSCFLLFFLGAPIGVLLKKGGLGAPLVVATLLYILYHVLSITGEKLAEEDVLLPWMGAWLSTAALIPIAFVFYQKAGISIRQEFKTLFQKN